MGKASIRDVANLAGVSIATVSQVLNGKGERFSDATKQKVLAARDEVGYVPNASARSLKRGTTTMIGVIVPSLRNPYFGDIVQRMQEVLPENVSCLLYTSDAADEEDSVDLGGRRIIKKKTKKQRTK